MAHALPDEPTSIYRLTFWADALERIIAAASIAALAYMPADAVNNGTFSLRALAVAAATGAGLELARSLAALYRGNPGTASLTKATRSGAVPGVVARFTGGQG